MMHQPMDKRIMARFIQQCWMNDYAVDTGVVKEFDVTESVLAMRRDAALALKDNRDETDALVPAEIVHALAPGEPICFYVEVEEAIRDYFTAHGAEVAE